MISSVGPTMDNYLNEFTQVGSFFKRARELEPKITTYGFGLKWAKL